MLETGVALKRLYEQIKPAAQNLRIADLRVGLSYVGVKLDNGAMGIAAVLPDLTQKSCTVLNKAGTYIGSDATVTLAYLIEGSNSLYRSIGVATANALVKPPHDSAEDREATTHFNLKPGENVVMVGLFAPLVKRIRDTGAKLTIIEKNPERLDLLTDEDRQKALKECNVAIITATTLLNNTFETTIASLSSPRLVAIIGPSTPLVPKIFSGIPVTHLGGAIVTDSQRVSQIISEGGGTPALRPYLCFVNLILK